MSPKGIGPRRPAGGPPLEGAPTPEPAEAVPAPPPAPTEATPTPAPTPAPAEAAPAPAPAETAPVAPPPDAQAEPAPAPALETISEDDLTKAVKFILAGGKANVYAIQRGCNLKYDRAKKVMEAMEERGLIGPPPKPGKSREILVTKWPPDTTATPDTATPDTPLTRAGGAAADLDTTATAAPADTGTTPAEPPPDAEPAPAPAEPAPPTPEPTSTPEPTAPKPEALPTTPEVPPTPLTKETPKESFHWFETPRRIMVEATKRFLSKFRGEVQAEEDKDHKASWGDVTRNATMGLISVAASYTGIKFFGDLGARAWQSLVSNPAERKRIQSALLAKEAELGETTEPSAIDQKKARLEEAINASKFLTTEKKTQLLADLHEKVAEYEEKDRSLRAKRDKDIVDILNEAIQTRVKNTQLFKEGLNTALMATGFSAMRGVAYGAVAVYERHQEVAKRLEEKSKKEGKKFEKDKAFYKEWIVDGFTETLHNLIGGKEKFFSAKGGMNVVKGATNILRAAGFADLAIAEWTGEGRSVESIIDTSLKAWEQKSAGEFFADNARAPLERLTGLAGDAKEAATGSTPTPERWLTNEELGESDATEPTERAGTGDASSVEIPEAQVEAGLVKKGDGIIKILERQGIEAKAALDAAREAGIVRAGGDTRLTTEAIGRLSVFAEPQPDGDIEIRFFDTETDKLLTLAQAREAGFTYESGTVPGEIPTNKEVVEHAAQPSPDADTETSIRGQDSPNVPNELLGGTFKIETDEAGNFVDVHYGEGDPLKRINDALAELRATGHGDSAEARYLEETYIKVYEALHGSIVTDGAPAAELEEVRARNVAVDEVTGIAAGEPLKKFIGEAGKVKFIYDKETGAVKDAFMPAYTPGRRDIEDSLKEWGLTNKEVKDHFFEGVSRTHMDGTANDYRQFVRDVERLSRQKSLLEEMEVEGLARTPEYARLASETSILKTGVENAVKEQFPGSSDDSAQIDTNPIITDSGLFNYGDDSYREVLQKLQSGEYTLVPDATPPPIELVGDSEKVNTLLASQGLKIEGTSILSKANPTEGINWGQIIIDTNGNVISESSAVQISAKGTKLIATLINTDGSREKIIFENGAITSATYNSP